MISCVLCVSWLTQPDSFGLEILNEGKELKFGADGGGRTHTLVRVPAFESSASANSATSATGTDYIFGGDRSKSFFRLAGCKANERAAHPDRLRTSLNINTSTINPPMAQAP